MSKKDPDKVWITVSETINTGNYESVKIEAGYSREYEGDPTAAISKGIDEMRDVVEAKAKKIRKKHKRK